MNPLELLKVWEDMPGLVETFGISIAATDTGIRTTRVVTPAMRGGPAVAHGGVLAALLDRTPSAP